MNITTHIQNTIRSRRIILVVISLMMAIGVGAQNYNPLIPSKKNDRLIEQAQKEQQEREARKAEREAKQAERNAKKAAGQEITEEEKQEEAAAQKAAAVEALEDEIQERDSAVMQPIQTEDMVRTEVEYDPITGNYILHRKIGDTEIASPTLMSPTEYARYSEGLMMHSYWQEKIQNVEHSNERKFDITDMKFNIGPADKIFGPGGVQIKMQGSAEFLFGFKHQYINNPALTERARNNNIFDFNEKIQASVNAKVGEKINFKLNYNTESSFSFDQQNLKLTYQGNEDDIIQSIEAGNVTMDLNSNLIQGSKALFGVKTNLQFGKLKVQALVSQQNSESKTVSSEGGAQTQKYEIPIDRYDENRHFFLSYFFRDKYEKAMETLPNPVSGVTINRIEVWVTNKRGNFDDARNIVATVDLGEGGNHTRKPDWGGMPGMPADNKANALYSDMNARGDGLRDISQVSSTMITMDMQVGDDYEKVESARLLNSGEYTLNPVLGYISLKQTLQQDEVLAVAYEYTYNGTIYQVGEFSTDKNENLAAPRALFLKLLKSTNTAPDVTGKGRGTWDLMMKNVYSLGATSVSSEKFELGVFYRNDTIGTNMQYITEGAIKNQMLLRVMGLDRLDSRNNPSPDGKFDFVEGYTIQSSTGRIFFPTLEPFGDYLGRKIQDPLIARNYIFTELYDSTLVQAQEMSEKNKFVLRGRYKGSSGNQISLGAMNVPRGSVTVTAGGATLVENVDYTVDYISGIVTIINENIISSGTAVNVSLENQATFSMTRKTLVGAHLEYAFNPDLTIGGTIMHMSERPLTTKVNSGNEPISNTIWGLNFAWKTELPWINTAINAIPWMKATAPSTFQIQGEFAHLIPGHTSEVGKGGTAYIDDFESTTTGIDIHYPSGWKLSATPKESDAEVLSHIKAEGRATDKEYNKDRALLSWYTVDPIFGYPQANTPQHVRDSVEEMSDHRIRLIYEQEIYPNKETASTEDTRLSPLNLSFYPTQRGPYNIDAAQFDNNGNLINPKRKWGGIMRRLDNTDFETANIEYIEFWLMDPKFTNPDHPTDYNADMVIHLGDVSEDILRDGKKSFEHGLPTGTGDLSTRLDSTYWALVPRTNSGTVAFSNEAGARRRQDVGLNGLSHEQEKTFGAYKEFRDAMETKVGAATWAAWQDDPSSIANDPAGDYYHYYRGSDYDRNRITVLNRYKYYNGTEGNSPVTEDQSENYGTAASLTPDVEDVNNDNTLSENEKFWEYRIHFSQDSMAVGKQNIASKVESNVTLRTGEVVPVTWYQFKVPIREGKSVNNMRSLKSVRFMRMILTNTENDFHLRFGTLDLVRGDWRAYNQNLEPGKAASNASLAVQTVNIEEDGTRQPVNYVLPPGVSRQTDPGQAQLIAQNEQSMVLRVRDLPSGEGRAVYKSTIFDMRNYKRLQMFVHAEKLPTDNGDDQLRDNDMRCFIRIGSDLKNNYYEYEVPLALTPEGRYNTNSEEDRQIVWPKSNYMDFPLSVLTSTKLQRNKLHRAGDPSAALTVRYTRYDPENENNLVHVIGSPTLEDVAYIMIGVRNADNQRHDAEVWVNELRLSEFDESGGVAAQASAALTISDIAQFNVSGRLETAGYGSIESNVLTRNMEDNYQLSLSAALEAGRLLPEKAKLQIPLYVSYSAEMNKPKYNPLDSDTKLSESLEGLDKQEKDSINNRARTVQETTTFSVTNFKVNIHSKKKDMFYDPANFSISASYSKSKMHNPEVQREMNTEQRGSFNYSYNFNPKPWEPGKKSKSKSKFVKEFNIYYLPQMWSFSTNMHRQFSLSEQRNLTDFAVSQRDMVSSSKDFTWDRNFNFQYNLTKNMKFSLQTAMNSTIDEGTYAREVIRDYEFAHQYYEAWRDTIRRSLAKWGSPYTYQQVFTMSWNVPFNRIPYLEALSANASYTGNYNWSRTQASIQGVNYGNTVTSTRQWQIDGGLNAELLYGKWKYWKKMTQLYQGRIKSKPQRKPAKQTSLGDNDKNQDKRKQVDNGGSDYKWYDMFAYMLTSVRKVQVTYRRTDAISASGFTPGIGFFGQDNKNDMGAAPGWDFAFGFFKDDWVQRAKEKGWLNSADSIAQPATKSNTEDIDIRINLEPLPGLKVQVNGKRYIANSTSINYAGNNYIETLSGSYNITQVGLGTMFSKIGGPDDNYANATFDRFLEYRDVMQGRVQERYDRINAQDPLANPAAKVSRNSADVMIPAFLAAYTGKDIQTIGYNPFLGILKILPNWSVTYDGLSKLPGVRDHFRSFTLTHAYTCKYSIGSYGSYSTWRGCNGDDKTLGYITDVTTGNPTTPSSAYDISNVTLTEALSPLIGVNMTLKNSLSFKSEYRKQRNLALNITSVQLTESHTDEFVLGAGYTIKDLGFTAKNMQGQQKRVTNDLKLSVDVSYKDIKSFMRKIDEGGLAQTSAGSKVFTIKIAADYVISQKLNIQLYYDHEGTMPLLSTAYPIKTDNVGVNVKLMLTR